MLYEGLEIYQAKIEDETDGVFCISLVDFPAVEKDFVCFNKQDKQNLMFAIENEDKQNITGVVMLADTPIYRRNGDYEYYITYSKETIEKMANKLLKDGFQNRVDLQHDGKLITGISMTELYIKDASKGINPSFFTDITDGSLLATFHVEDNELWNEIKNGETLNGFSLEGLFTIEKMNNNKINKKNKMSKIAKFIKSLMKFGEVSTDKGIIYWEGEGELEVGVEVYIDGENEEKVLADNGEYKVDSKTIVIEDGKVIEIKEDETVEDETNETVVEEIVEAEEVVEDTIVEEPVIEDDKITKLQNEIDSLKSEISTLKSEIDSLKELVTKITNEPIVEPIVEEFETVNKKESKFNKAAKLFANLNK